MSDPRLNLVLFFTRGVSLRTWHEAGMLSREAAIYERLAERGVRTTFVTYGDESDGEAAERIPGIRVCHRRADEPPPPPHNPIPWVPDDILATADLLKTNQTRGADAALAAARRFGKPFIARCGYMWSQVAISQNGADSDAAREALAVEAEVFSAADRVIVTTEAMRQDVAGRLPSAEPRVRVVPNYVDTDRFCPGPARGGQRRRLCFVGRLNQHEKNLQALVAAIAGLDVELDLIGNGPLRNELLQAAARDPRLHLLGSVPNEHLPERLRAADAFVLPSFYEGHPKALLEAMACGLPVITTNVPGIRELIQHGHTGWLCGTGAESLRAGIQAVLGDAALADQMGATARRYIVEHCSLSRVVELELTIYREALSNARRSPHAVLA